VDGSLWVLPAGTPAPNPGDLVASRRFGELIRSLAQEFDAVVVDTAPAAAGPTFSAWPLPPTGWCWW
jgi:Mrp family chromosome partitioning ATPase